MEKSQPVSLNCLNNLGLNNYEKNVYINLLENGISSPTEIERKTNIHRPIVYKSLESLVGKDLVSISPDGKRKKYIAESPDKLESLFKKLENNYLSEIEDLHRLYEIGKSDKPQVTYYRGESAIKDSYMDIVNTLNKNGRYYRYLSMSSLNREKYIPKGYREKRDKKGLERLIISNKESFKNTQRLGSRVKILPKGSDFLEDNYGQTIYGDKVAIIDFESKIVTLIKSRRYANFQEKIFKALFDRLQ